MVTHCLQQPQAYNHWSIDSLIFGLLNGSVIKPSWFIAIYINVHVLVNEENKIYCDQWNGDGPREYQWKGEKETLCDCSKMEKKIIKINKTDHGSLLRLTISLLCTQNRCHVTGNITIYLNQMTNHLGNHYAL